MTGVGFPAFGPVVVADAEAPSVSVEVRTHYFIPRLVVVSVAGTEGGTAALDEAGALALVYALTDWVVARRAEVRKHGAAVARAMSAVVDREVSP